MKFFAVILAIGLIGGSHAFIGGLGDLFHNLGQELSEVGKDIVHVAEPLANQLMQTLAKSGTQLLTTAASDLLAKLGPTTTSKRDLSEIMDKVGSFVTKGEQYLKETGSLLEGAFKGTLGKVGEEITHVLNNAKPIENLVNEVKAVVAGHNNFVDSLISNAAKVGEKLVAEIMHLVPHKRDLGSFVQGLEHLVQQVANPLKGVMDGLVSKLEGQVLSLLG